MIFGAAIFQNEISIFIISFTHRIRRLSLFLQHKTIIDSIPLLIPPLQPLIVWSKVAIDEEKAMLAESEADQHRALVREHVSKSDGYLVALDVADVGNEALAYEHEHVGGGKGVGVEEGECALLVLVGVQVQGPEELLLWEVV